MSSFSSRQRNLVAAALLVAAVLGTWWWSQRGANDPVVEMAEMATGTADFPAVEDSAIGDPEARVVPMPGAYELIDSIDHDPSAFTQGLEFDGGDLYEGTGLRGESTLRQIDPANGATIRSVDLPDEIFGEGITVVDDELIQLSWTSGIAYRWDKATFEPLGTFTYEGEGWGICNAGDQLVMSNGSADLTFRRPDDFSVIDTVTVTFSGAPVTRLNELECVGDVVWANIWLTPLIIEIDPATGTVLTVIDASDLRPESTEGDAGAVLNGIAYDEATDTFLLSGKLWPTTFRVRLG